MYEFEFPKLERLDLPTGRKYRLPDGSLVSSVTTILQATQSEESKKGLEAWANRVGLKEAETIRNQAAALGTIIHENIEKYFNNQEIKIRDNYIHKIANKMFNTLLNEGLSQIEQIVSLEGKVFYPGLYAGTFDLLCIIDGRLTVGDFKNSIKIKKESYLDGYYCQLIAYITAINNMFGTNIRDGRIMMIARPDTNGKCAYKDFDLDTDKFNKFEDMWLAKLEQFYSQNSQ